MRTKRRRAIQGRKKRVDLKKIKAAGGVLFRKVKGGEPEVLLIRRNGYWDIPKGKLEDHETIEECAAREVAEETGIPVPEIRSYLCGTYHEYDERGERFGKTTYWYSMAETGRAEYSPQIEEGITELKWIDVDTAEEMVEYDNLREVLAAFKRSL
jgi:8-oxo-dGTP pyrophosphatase MutT (NUDIX family)